MVSLVISGFGTVGQGVAEVLLRRKEFLTGRYGAVPKVVCVMDSKTVAKDPEGLDLAQVVKRKQETRSVGEERYTDSLEVLDSVDYDLLIEVTPTDIKTGGVGLKNITHAF